MSAYARTVEQNNWEHCDLGLRVLKHHHSITLCMCSNPAYFLLFICSLNLIIIHTCRIIIEAILPASCEDEWTIPHKTVTTNFKPATSIRCIDSTQQVLNKWDPLYFTSFMWAFKWSSLISPPCFKETNSWNVGGCSHHIVLPICKTNGHLLVLITACFWVRHLETGKVETIATVGSCLSVSVG